MDRWGEILRLEQRKVEKQRNEKIELEKDRKDKKDRNRER